MTLACGCALLAYWHKLCVKNGTGGTCLALRQLKEQRADAQGGSFLSLEVGMCPEQELGLLFEGEGGKSQIWKHSWGGTPESTGTMDPHLDPTLWGFLPVPHPSFTRQAVGIISGYPTGFAVSLHSQPPEVLYQTPQRYLKGQQGK